jgi:hypothetical protein
MALKLADLLDCMKVFWMVDKKDCAAVGWTVKSMGIQTVESLVAMMDHSPVDYSV